MKSKDLSPQLIERLTLEGLELFCRLMWQVASKQIQQEYSRFAMRKPQFKSFLEISAWDSETMTGFKMASELLPHITTMSGKVSAITQSIEESQDIDNMLEETSLSICRLGGQSSIADVKYYFRKEIEHEKGLVSSLEKQILKIPLPQWILRQTQSMFARAKRLKELKAPKTIVESAFDQLGGKKDMSIEERARFYYQEHIDRKRDRVVDLENILSDLEHGNLVPALLHISELLETSVFMYENARIESYDLKTGEVREKTGVLSVFVRKTKRSMTLDTEVIESDFHLYQSLLGALQPTSGKA